MKGIVAPQLARRCRWLAIGLVLALLCSAAWPDAPTPLAGAWRAAVPGDGPARVLQAFRDGDLKPFDPALLQRLPTDGLGSWVVLAPQPPHVAEARVLSIYPAPLGTVTLYDRLGPVRATSLEDFADAPHGHGRLAFLLPPHVTAAEPLLLRFEPHTTIAAPVSFRLQRTEAFQREDTHWLLLVTGCFAVMATMSLMALCFALMLRDVTFAWYAGYVLCYMLVQCVQTGFLFHPLGLDWLVGSALLLGDSAVALSVAFAALFVTRFCELARYAPLLRLPVLALGVGMPLVVLLHSSRVPLLEEVAQTLVNPLLLLGALLLLTAGLAAALRGARPAWFFLAGWTPLLVLTAMTSAQVDGALPGLAWLNDASIAAGAFEAIVLSLGLADRALTIRRDRDVVRALADRDALTNVLNRRAWSEAARGALAHAQARPLALLFLDLDRFKTLNDCLGHAAGDRALIDVATALGDELRPSDLLGRYGGEEFVALLDGADRDQAMAVATRLCRRVHRLELPVGEGGLMLSVSIGLAMHGPGDTLELLIERADQAMYQAKLGGRNRVRGHDELGHAALRTVPRTTDISHTL
ncbi:GGDEF domain-containing protein [Frateuria defendens]|uniref:GGDEF domain-containing protein n=1 Tax=Frateuria defendens TaxID=2219559 RepID=UPI0007DBF131|nr:diguanylate cyclase [Frateuria defendens]